MVESPVVQIICFSMDRVFQLSEYLRTLHDHLYFRGVLLRKDPSFARITIICKCTTEEICGYYAEIATQYAHVTFLYECETQDFAAYVLHILDQQNTLLRCPFLMFNVDDAFYFDDVEFLDICAFLNGNTDEYHTELRREENEEAGTSADMVVGDDRVWPFAFHVKLAPSIWRSHLTNKPMLPLPPLKMIKKMQFTHEKNDKNIDDLEHVVDYEQGYFTFDPAMGCFDWNYPWELSGSVYRTATVTQVIRDIQMQFGRKGISNPNYLELRGHQVVQQWMKDVKNSKRMMALRCACSASPKMHVFAINQVQDVFANRLYDITSNSRNDSPSLTKVDAGELTNLLRLYQAKKTLDEGFYHRNRLASVHIGTLVLKPSPSSQRNDQTLDFAAALDAEVVSVVMPVYNVEKYVERSLKSIMMQTYQYLEIIVIDDASTDATLAIVERLQQTDSRIKLFRNDTNIGIAASLNKAFALASGKYIARMDGDDLAFPHRLERQVEFLKENPHISVLGSSILIAREVECGNDSLNESTMETVIYPTSPLVTKWKMFFGCFLAHPSVMIHHRVVDICKKRGDNLFDLSLTSSEDYDLWLRCLYRYHLSIASLGDVLLVHRKHRTNVSSVHREQQIQETHAIVSSCVKEILDSEAGNSIAPLLENSQSHSIDELIDATHTLRRLQEHVRQQNVGENALSQSSSDHDEYECEREYICNEAAAREGEVALRAMVTDPFQGTQLWSAFAARNPQLSRSAFQKLLGK